MELRRLSWFRRPSREAEAIAALERVNARLIDALVQLGRAGVPVPPALAPDLDTGEDEELDDLGEQIRQAIAQMADRGSDEEVELEAYARRRLADGTKASDVAHEILEGQDPFALLE